MPLRVDVYSIMRNEARILPYFLRHYETIASRILVWDDASDDGTAEMLRAHPLVTVLPLHFHGANDWRYVRELWPQYESLSAGQADWCIAVDADEFVYHPNLLGRLEEMQAARVKKIRCAGYTMWSETWPTTDGQIYDEVKLGVPDRWSTKPVVFAADAHMHWGMGRHFVMPQRNVPVVCNSGIKLLHFRYLGHDYFMSRNEKNDVNMGVGYNPNRPHNMPDGTRAVPEVWYSTLGERAIPVV